MHSSESWKQTKSLCLTSYAFHVYEIQQEDYKTQHLNTRYNNQKKIRNSNVHIVFCVSAYMLLPCGYFGTTL